MIHFYKPTAKVTGTACSFYLNKRDNAFFSTLIKQDGWNSERRVGSFKKNKDNPNKKVNIKFSPLEIASIMDSINRNQKFTGYHGSNQIVRFTFGPYVRKGESELLGFSFSVTKESKEDSTEKSSYLIGFNFGEAELLVHHLSHSSTHCRQDFQLARAHVPGIDFARIPHALCPRIHRPVHDGWTDRLVPVHDGH